MTRHALLLWSPEAELDADVLAIREAAVDLGSPRVNIDGSRERFEVDGVWVRRVVVHVMARLGEEARKAVRARVAGREVGVVVDG